MRAGSGAFLRLCTKIVGWIYCLVGVGMILGFLFVLDTPKGNRLKWQYLETVLVVGLLPLTGGILLLLRSYELARRIMLGLGLGFLFLFGIACVTHLVLPDFAPQTLGAFAAWGLIGAVLAAPVWWLAFMRAGPYR